MKKGRSMKRLLWLWFFLFLPLKIYPVVILVHGTFAHNAKWYKPSGDFYKVLENSAAEKGETLVPFMWSGKLSHKARMAGAEALVKLITSYPEDEKVVLIGHSHGGNVISLASHLLYDPVAAIMDLYWQEGGPKGIESFVETIVQQHLGFSRSTRTTKKEYMIDKVFLLATPVLKKEYYSPCMEVINNVYNLYSLGDYVQSALGFCSRKYQVQDRVTNVQVKIKGSGLFGGDDPTHERMHDVAIAGKLLSLTTAMSLLEF